jgi:hypothetical protein
MILTAHDWRPYRDGEEVSVSCRRCSASPNDQYPCEVDSLDRLSHDDIMFTTNTESLKGNE